MNLFHGTSKNDPVNIIQGEEGFDLRLSNNGVYGRAIYFAEDASYCNQGYAYSSSFNEKQIFLAQVLLGNSIQTAGD